MGNLPQIAWLVAGICFILSLGGLSQHETARRGNIFGIVGMSLAILATLVSMFVGHFDVMITVLLFAAIAVGATMGAYVAGRVDMKQMPELLRSCTVLLAWPRCWWD